MADGQLQCAGSSLFLKKTYGVGYQLTIEKKKIVISKSEEPGLDPEENDDKLKDIVTSAVSGANLLSNVGSEMSYQLPMGASSQFGPMFEGLDQQLDN